MGTWGLDRGTDLTQLVGCTTGKEFVALGSTQFSSQCQMSKNMHFWQNSNSLISFLINVTCRVSYIKGY